MLAVDEGGHILLAWAEGTGWQKGGSLAWQVFDEGLKPLAASRGSAPDVPVWSFGAVAATADGFVIVK